MHRPLNQATPDAVLDPGLELVTFGPALHEPVRLAHNAAFRDHWGSEPRDEEAWGFVVKDPQARPDLSGVVLDRSNGTVAGYQLATHDAEAALIRGFREGYTELLGVRREFRGRGIAQVLLADAMRRFAAAGMDVASLDVDSENPTGALALYLKLGYTAVNRSMAWDKELDAGRLTLRDALSVHIVEVMDDVVQEVLRERQDRELRTVAAGARPGPFLLRDPAEGRGDLLARRRSARRPPPPGRRWRSPVSIAALSWSQSSNRASSSVSMSVRR